MGFYSDYYSGKEEMKTTQEVKCVLFVNGWIMGSEGE